MVTLVEVNIGLKIIDTLLIEIVDQYLIFMGEVDISLIPTTLTPITYVAMICSLGFSFSSLPVCENVHGDKIIGYSGHGYKRSYISSDAGDERGDISGDDGICGCRSKETSHCYFQYFGECFDGDGRGGYRSQTIYSSYHNPGDHGRLLCISIASRCVHKILHDNKRSDIDGDDGRRGFMSQDTIHYSFLNNEERADSDGIGG